jgi:hypothetical protein
MKRLLFVCALLASSCASAEVMRLDNVARPSTEPDSIRVLLEEPAEPYTSIAMVVVSDDGWGLSLEKIKRRVVAEAAKLGGEAVIVGHQSGRAGTTFIPVGQTWIAADVPEKKLVGKVIVYTARNDR